MTLTLAQRVAITAGLAVLVVVTPYAVVSHHIVRRAVESWERQDLAALGHHAADMLDAAPEAARDALARTLSDELAGFGVRIIWAETGRRPPAGAVLVPLHAPGEILEVTRSQDVATVLGGRLARINVLLVGTVLIALLLAVEASIYWGLVRPVHAIKRQLRLMQRGPWTAAADAGGARELVGLAREIESVGAVLDRQVSQWVQAERRAVAELARCDLRAATLPYARKMNLAATGLLASKALSPRQVRELRRLIEASDALTMMLAPGTPVDRAANPQWNAEISEEQGVPSATRCGDEAAGSSAAGSWVATGERGDQ